MGRAEFLLPDFPTARMDSLQRSWEEEGRGSRVLAGVQRPGIHPSIASADALGLVSAPGKRSRGSAEVLEPWGMAVGAKL